MKNIKKRCGFWAGLVLAVFLVQSCQMPSRIKIVADDIGFDVKMGDGIPFIDMFTNSFDMENLTNDLAPIETTIEVGDVDLTIDSITLKVDDFGAELPDGSYGVPQEIADMFTPDSINLPDGFLNATIESGSFSLTGTTTTGIQLVSGGKIAIIQNPVTVNGDEFLGLGAEGPWTLGNNGTYSLADRYINGEIPEIDTQNSTLKMNLSQLNGATEIKFEMKIGIESFKTVRLNKDFITQPELIDVDLSGMLGGDIPFKDVSINMEYLNMKLDFSEGSLPVPLRNNIYLQVESDGLNMKAKELLTETTILKSEGEFPLEFKDFSVEMKFVPKNGKYFELGPINFGKNLEIVGTVGLGFGWKDITLTPTDIITLPMFNDKTDLFNRESPSDPLFGDEKIKLSMLRVKIDFQNAEFFDGTTLVLGKFDDGEDLTQPLSKNSLEFSLNEADFDKIRGSLLNPSGMGINFPQSPLTISKDLKAMGISVGLSGSLTINTGL